MIFVFFQLFLLNNFAGQQPPGRPGTHLPKGDETMQPHRKFLIKTEWREFYSNRRAKLETAGRDLRIAMETVGLLLSHEPETAHFLKTLSCNLGERQES